MRTTTTTTTMQHPEQYSAFNAPRRKSRSNWITPRKMECYRIGSRVGRVVIWLSFQFVYLTLFSFWLWLSKFDSLALKRIHWLFCFFCPVSVAINNYIPGHWNRSFRIVQITDGRLVSNDRLSIEFNKHLTEDCLQIAVYNFPNKADIDFCERIKFMTKTNCSVLISRDFRKTKFVYLLVLAGFSDVSVILWRCDKIPRKYFFCFRLISIRMKKFRL